MQTWSAGAVVTGHLSLRLLGYQPRRDPLTGGASPTGPRSPASHVSRPRVSSGTQATSLLSDRSWTGNQSSQSYAGTRPLEDRSRADTRSELALVTSDGLAPTSEACRCRVDGADGSCNVGTPDRPYIHIYIYIYICIYIWHALAASWQTHWPSAGRR